MGPRGYPGSLGAKGKTSFYCFYWTHFKFPLGDKGDRGLVGPKGLNGFCLDSQKGELGPKGEKGKDCEPIGAVLPPGTIYIKGQAGEKGDKGKITK